MLEGFKAPASSVDYGSARQVAQPGDNTAQEKLEQNDEEQDEEPDDSTDEWGMGSTAVLEPPRPDAPNPDDGPDFPVGFPLRDFEEADAPQPAASESDIAMLNRMFGTSN